MSIQRDEQQAGWTLRDVTRRQVLQLMAAGAGAGTLAAFLAACGSSDESTPASAGSESGGGSGASTTTSGGSSASSGDATPAASAAASSTESSGGNTAEPTGKATVAQGPKITNLDASMQTGMLTFNVSIHMLEPLLLRGDDLQPAPFLAEKVSNPDNKTIHLTLRDGVKFHNGDPLTVDDVVFTLQRVITPDSKSQQARYTASVESATAIDDKTVEIKLSEPDVTFIGHLALIPIVPKKVVEKVGDDAFNANPVGTGAWKFVEWKKGEGVTMEVFSDYWRDQPAIKTLEFRGMPEDATRIAALRTGALDVATNVPTQLVSQVKDSDKTKITTVNSQIGRAHV